jgi:MFS family permease
MLPEVFLRRGGMVLLAALFGIPWALAVAIAYFQADRRGHEEIWAALVVGALLLGIAIAALMWRVMLDRWPAARDLNPEERVAAAHAVRTGGPVTTWREASAVIEGAEVTRRMRTQHQRHPLLFGSYLFVVAAVAVTAAVLGRVLTAVGMALLLVGFAIQLNPRRRERALRNASRAAQSAQELLVTTARPAATT